MKKKRMFTLFDRPSKKYQFHFFPTREISWYVHNLIFSYFLPNCNSMETVYVIVLTSKEYEMDMAWIYVVYLRFRATLNYSSSGHIHLHNFFFSTFSMKIFMVDEYQLSSTTGVSRKIPFQTVWSTQWFSVLHCYLGM